MIQHRPEMHFQIPDLEQMCKNLGYPYLTGSLESFAIEPDRVVLVAGAGILPDDFIQSHVVINAHPGYIPNCRGLDSFKWAIAENQPIGVTTHLIGEHVDAEKVIERRLIDVYKMDSFHALAEWVYENEVSMLIEAVAQYDRADLETIFPGDHPLHKRMPAEIEQNLFQLFEQ